MPRRSAVQSPWARQDHRAGDGPRSDNDWTATMDYLYPTYRVDVTPEDMARCCETATRLLDEVGFAILHRPDPHRAGSCARSSARGCITGARSWSGHARRPGSTFAPRHPLRCPGTSSVPWTRSMPGLRQLWQADGPGLRLAPGRVS